MAGEHSAEVDGPSGYGDAFERFGIAAKVGVIGVRSEELGQSFFAGAGDPDGDQAVGVAIGERTEQDFIDDAEDSSGGADPQGEREDRDQGKPGAFEESSCGEAKVLDDLSYGDSSRLLCKIFRRL